MKKRILAFMVITIGAACLAEGYWIYGQRSRWLGAPDEFQARHELWVSEIEGLKKSLPAARPEEQDSLGQAFEEWFQARAAVSGIRSEVRTTASQVIVSFKIPGLRPETLKIVVNDVLIRANYSARAFVRNAAAGGENRVESLREFETVMPLPENADVGRHRFVPEGEGFKIIFEKREDPSLKS